MIHQDKKAELVTKFRTHEKDTGSVLRRNGGNAAELGIHLEQGVPPLRQQLGGQLDAVQQAAAGEGQRSPLQTFCCLDCRPG